MSPSLLDIRFIALMLGVIALRLALGRRWGVTAGALASAAVIGVASWQTLVLIGGSMLLIAWPLALAIRRARAAGAGPARAKFLLGTGIAVMVAVWLAYKLERRGSLPAVDHTAIAGVLAGSLGLSYFLFRAINFLYMHYLVDIPERSPARPLYYALFPSTITSGPIHKYLDFRREVDTPRSLALSDIGEGVYRITQGYFYKVCIAALIDRGAERLLLIEAPNAYESIATIASLYLYFFFDFAGYSHIAIGLGLLLGIRVPENFRQPFLATSITEFWRNWHITIADWFRDHVFIPLGGMRLGGLRAASLAAGIMLLCGLWHDFTVPFACWGAWHASMLFLEGVTGARPMPPAERHGPVYWLRILWTNARIALGAIFFLPSLAKSVAILKGLLVWW